MSLQDFVILEKIGQGSYAEVFKVRRIHDNCIYAMKKIPFRKLSDKEVMNSLNEVRILASIQNPHIISYKESFYDQMSSHLYIITELAERGDLHRRIRTFSQNEMKINENEIVKMTYQISTALKHLHDLSIIHRDIKSSNIFITANNDYKPGDLNISKISQEGMLFTKTGTPYYASPEIWKDQPYDNKTDIWSLGCVIYEMANFVPPFMSQSIESLYMKVTKGYYQKLSSYYSSDLSILVRIMLSQQSTARPSAREIINMSQFNQIRVHEATSAKLLKTIMFNKNSPPKLPKQMYIPRLPIQNQNQKQFSIKVIQSQRIYTDPDLALQNNRPRRQISMLEFNKKSKLTSCGRNQIKGPQTKNIKLIINMNICNSINIKHIFYFNPIIYHFIGQLNVYDQSCLTNVGTIGATLQIMQIAQNK